MKGQYKKKTINVKQKQHFDNTEQSNCYATVNPQLHSVSQIFFEYHYINMPCKHTKHNRFSSHSRACNWQKIEINTGGVSFIT